MLKTHYAPVIMLGLLVPAYFKLERKRKLLVENTILSHALLYFRTAPRYFLTREGRGLHFFWAIGGERSET